MKLDDEYSVDTDQFQFILKKTGIGKKGKSKGEEVVLSTTYHGNFATLLRKYIKAQMLEEVSSAKNVGDLIEKVEKMEDRLEKKLDQIGKEVNLKLWNQNKPTKTNKRQKGEKL